ncbi:MAG: hypothetical protein IPP44_23535 [Ideonella sp.]|nr:hypothetical protein [Ideonella sp.]
MRTDLPVITIALVVALTVVAASFRVVTAPDRIRERLDSARSTCLNQGGEWVTVGRDESCVMPAAKNKTD